MTNVLIEGGACNGQGGMEGISAGAPPHTHAPLSLSPLSRLVYFVFAMNEYVFCALRMIFVCACFVSFYLSGFDGAWIATGGEEDLARQPRFILLLCS